MKFNKTNLCLVTLVVYVGVLLCVTVLTREPVGKEAMQTHLFWGYSVDDPGILYRDNIFNILLYIPIGVLVACLVPKYRWLAAMLAGLFLSETVECSQLIWQRGVFDVDDLFNNTLGALLGGLLAVWVIWFRKSRTLK